MLICFSGNTTTRLQSSSFFLTQQSDENSHHHIHHFRQISKCIACLPLLGFRFQDLSRTNLSLSYPSTCQAKLGPGDVYSRLRSFLRRLRSQPSGSSSFINFWTSFLGTVIPWAIRSVCHSIRDLLLL